MTTKVHRSVKNTNDSERLDFDREKYDVLLVSDRTATVCQVVPKSTSIWAELDFGELFPHSSQIEFLLFGTPGLEGVVRNGLEIA
jgi:hypothetical protein